MSIPASYAPATWRNTTPVDPAGPFVGVGFDLDGGSIVRLRLPAKAARDLAETILAFLADHEARSQDDRSRGMPSVDVSCPPRTENVCPPPTSSAARSGLG